jgi:hypothetical protein
VWEKVTFPPKGRSGPKAEFHKIDRLVSLHDKAACDDPWEGVCS